MTQTGASRRAQIDAVGSAAIHGPSHQGPLKGTTFYEAGFVKRPSQPRQHLRGTCDGTCALVLRTLSGDRCRETAVLLADLGVGRSR